MPDMISCIILAGGKSERMQPEESKIAKLKERIKKRAKRGKKGKRDKGPKPKKKQPKLDKAFMTLDEKPMVLHVYETVRKFFPEIVIVVKTKSQESEMKKIVSDPKARIVADKTKSFSPVIGIKAGLQEASGEHVFVIGCDMPFVNGVTIFRMINRVKKGVECIVPSKNKDGERRYETLCAIYDRRVFDDAKADESLHDIIDSSKKLLIPVYNESIFFNINTPEDMNKAKQMIDAKAEKKK